MPRTQNHSSERDCHSEPLSCGHFACGAQDLSIYWMSDQGMTGTVCFDCALLAERYGLHVTIIPTNEQMLAELDWELAGIGTN
jgi:hypothetical protein